MVKMWMMRNGGTLVLEIGAYRTRKELGEEITKRAGYYWKDFPGMVSLVKVKVEEVGDKVS